MSSRSESRAEEEEEEEEGTARERERERHSPGSMFGDVLETPDLSPVVTYSEDSVYHL